MLGIFGKIFYYLSTIVVGLMIFVLGKAWKILRRKW